MSAGNTVKGNRDNTRVTVCPSESSTIATNGVDSNPDIFLAASLRFLHRLLAERRLRYAKPNHDGTPMSRLQTGDVQQQGNNSAGQLYLPQIDQIEEYKRQLRSMENFLSTIQLDADKPMRNTEGSDAIMFNQTNDLGHCRDRLNFEPTKLHDDSCDFISQNPSLRNSSYRYSFFNDYESPADISEQAEIHVTGIEGPGIASTTVRKTAPDAESDFTGRPDIHSGIPARTSAKNDGLQSSASYADIVRNAVSGLARNYGKKHKTERKKHAADSWLLETGLMASAKEEKHQRGYQSEVESEISSKSQVRNGQDSDIPKEIPLRVQLAMETDASPRKPVTLLVRVPKTVFNLLNRKVSNRDTKIRGGDLSAEIRAEPGKKTKRITSVFRNFLKGRRTSSTVTVTSAKEKLPSRVTLASKETGISEEDQGNDTSRDTSIFALQTSASSDAFEQTRSAELCCEDSNNPKIESRNTEHASLECMLVPPTKSVSGYKEISLNSSPKVISYEKRLWNERADGTAWRKLSDDKALRTEVPSNKTEIVKGLINYHDEKIIPLRCSEGSPQLIGNNKRAGISQRDVDTFLELAAEMRKTQVYQDANNQRVEIPIKIRMTETPLRLHKTQNVSEDFLKGQRVFHPESKSSHETPNRIETQEFLEMLVGTLPEGAYFPQTEYIKSEELPPALDSAKNCQQNNIQLLGISEDSALEVLLRHIATDASITSCVKPYATEKDTTVQTAPKRQLSKISVCYSSESLSGSDHETPQVRMKNSTVSQDEYRVYNHVLSNEPRKPGISQYLPRYEAVQQNSTCSSADDKVMMYGKSEGGYPGVKIRTTVGSPKVTKIENLNLNLSPFSIQARRILEPCSTTEVIIEEQNCSTIQTEVKKRVVLDSESTSPSMQEIYDDRTIRCHPVLSRQICGDRKELADAMIRWWGPQINYSTTPSSQTQLSAYSVSINNLILRNG